MDVKFLKLQAGGNDYICIDTEKTQPPEAALFPALAKKICDRRKGVGAEGVFFLAAGEDGRLRAEIMTNKGVEGETCGAALQCAARYAFDSGLVKSKQFGIARGTKTVSLEVIDSINIRQDLGGPRVLGSQDELREAPDAVFTIPLIVDGHEYSCTPLMFEETHAVFFIASYGLPPSRLARRIDDQEPFRNDAGAEVDFVRVFSREELHVRAWKRGVGILNGCPKTAAAGLVAAVLNGFAEREALVHLRGGDLFVEWDEATNHAFFTGPAEYVFSGSFYFDEEH